MSPVEQARQELANARTAHAQACKQGAWNEQERCRMTVVRAEATVRAAEAVESPVKVALTGILDALGQMRWTAERNAERSGSGDFRIQADTIREVEALVKAGLS